MIEVSRLNQKKYCVNPMMIEQVEEAPDVTITLSNGKKLIVLDTKAEIISRIVAYWTCVFNLEKKADYLKSVGISANEAI